MVYNTLFGRYGGISDAGAAIPASLYLPFDTDLDDQSLNGFKGIAAGHGVPNDDAVIQSSVKKFGAGALKVDGTDDFLRFPPTVIPSGESAFTIEGWAYHIDSTVGDLISNGISNANRTLILHRRVSPEKLEVVYKSGGSTTVINVASGVSNGVWYHWAITLSGGTLRLFKDGTQIGSASVGTLDDCIDDFRIGARGAESETDDPQTSNAYFDDIRIINSASYTSNFTPPSSALGVGSSTLYLPFDTDFENDALSSPTTVSSTQAKFGGKSLSLNGTSQFVSFANNPEFQFGDGDFTIEAWVYQTAAAGSSPGDRHAIVARMSHALDRSFHFGIVADSGAQKLQFSFTSKGDNSTQYDFGVDVTINNWHHVAVVRSGSTVTGFLNGTALGTTGNIGTSSIFVGHSPLTIGYRGLSEQYFQGFIDDLRIIKGTAVYTSDFTPPGAHGPG